MHTSTEILKNKHNPRIIFVFSLRRFVIYAIYKETNVPSLTLTPISPDIIEDIERAAFAGDDVFGGLAPDEGAP